MNTTTPNTAAPTPSPLLTEPALDPVSLTELRAPAVRRLLALRTQRRFTRSHVHTSVQCLNVSERTVWR